MSASITKTVAIWRQSWDYLNKLADSRSHEGPGIQLACLVLADHCLYEWSGDRGGPTPEMIKLAEGLVGDTLERITSAMTETARSQDTGQ